MSSFIVEKREYIKAAGLMYGYEEAKRDSHRYFLDVCRKEFEHAYALNVISVNEQYDANYEPETESYDEVFESYRKMGMLISTGGYASDNGVIFSQVADVMDKKTFRLSMFSFFGSVLYQIENQDCSRAVSAWFYTCLSRLYEDDMHGIDSWFAEIELAA